MTSVTLASVDLDPMKSKKVWKEEESREIWILIMIIMHVWIENDIEKWRKEWIYNEEMMMDYLAFILDILEPVRF